MNCVKTIIEFLKSFLYPKLIYFNSHYKSFYFLTLLFSACCLMFIIELFFEWMDFIIFYKTNVDKEKKVLFLENQKLINDILYQKELYKNAQKKIRKLKKELLRSYD